MTFRRLAIVALGLAAGAAAFAQGLPLPGKYVSADGNFTLTITGANPGDGKMTGAYAANFGPSGAQQLQGHVGNYAWVDDLQGRSGQAPFVIRFGGGWREADWSYAQRDEWNGAYRADDTILAEGSRAYVASDGSVQVGSLGTQVFKLQH